ncbi:MAG: hypothetical protein PVI91_12145 [Gammaproteobacteria bacterium]
MPGLRAEKAALSATVVIPDAVFERHSPFCPKTVGEQLAEQLDDYARKESLGYYPALGYLQKRSVLDEQLLAALDQLTWLGTSLVREELRSRLRPLFASLQVQSMQALVYSMPPVRPGRPRAFEQLVEHLTPNRARFDLLLAVLRRRGGTGDLESYIRRASYRHLRQAFDTIDITNVKVLEQSGNSCPKS